MIAGLPSRHDRSALRQRCRPRWHVDGRDAWGFQARHPVRVVNGRVRSQHNGNLKLPFSFLPGAALFKPKRTFLSIITLISIHRRHARRDCADSGDFVMTGSIVSCGKKIIDFDAHILVKKRGRHARLANASEEDR